MPPNMSKLWRVHKRLGIVQGEYKEKLATIDIHRKNWLHSGTSLRKKGTEIVPLGALFDCPKYGAPLTQGYCFISMINQHSFLVENGTTLQSGAWY